MSARLLAAVVLRSHPTNLDIPNESSHHGEGRDYVCKAVCSKGGSIDAKCLSPKFTQSTGNNSFKIFFAILCCLPWLLINEK